MGKLSHLKKAVKEAKRRVYQGSPHKYDGKLDPSKIGTGEGAQAYGYGHYLAENPNVAEGYRRVHTPTYVDEPPKTLEYKGRPPKDLEDAVGRRALRVYNNRYFGEDVAKAADKLELDKSLKDAKIYSRWLRENAGDIRIVDSTHLYEFDLPESAIDNMLDWDAPLSEQPVIMDLLQDRTDSMEYDGIGMDGVIEDVFDEDLINEFGMPTGRDFYDKLLYQANENGAEASAFVKNLGITGIKYHDGMSRAAGEGTRNFVIFPGNEDLVKAVSRNGEKLSAAALAPLAGIGLMGTFSEDSQAGVGGTIKAAGRALDMSEAARMQRAADMGFDVDAYHGTMRHSNDMDGIDEFKLDAHGDRLGVHVGSKRSANDRIDHIVGPSDRDWDMAAERGEAPYMIPLKVKAKKPLRLPDLGYWEPNTVARELARKGVSLPEPKTFQGSPYYTNNQLRQAIKDAGYDSIVYRNNVEGVGSDSYIILDPTNIRSVNAAFDPAKKDTADLLASMGGTGVLGAAALSPEDARAAELEAIALYGEPERKWRPTEKRNKWKQFKQQFVEPLGTIASSLASLPVSGLEGLGALAQGYGIDDAVGAMERRQEAMTYIPGSEAGRQSLANVGEAMEILGESPPIRMATGALDHGADVAYRYGSKVHPKVGAALGATVKTLPEVIF